MASVHVIDHPLIEAKLTHMRDRDTTSPCLLYTSDAADD